MDLGGVQTLGDAAFLLRTPFADGGTMAWRTWGEGPPIVLLHGGYGSWTHWIRNIPRLAESHRVIAPDLPGLGDSDAPSTSVDLHDIAHGTASGLRELLEPKEAAAIVGFSFGAAVAATLCADAPTLVRYLVVVGPGGMPRVSSPIQLRQWRAEVSDDQRAEAHRLNLKRLMIADSGAVDDLAVSIQSTNTARARFRGRSITHGGVLAECLPHVSVPVAAIYGERDATVHPNLARRLRDLRQIHPSIKIQVIAGGGHWIQYEKASEFNDALLAIIEP